MDDTRLYSFAAGLYLSPIQCGIQTAHVVSEMYTTHRALTGPWSDKFMTFDRWAENDKTIIVCNALHHGGVLSAALRLKDFGEHFNLPYVTFHEDEVSMNGMATACGIVVPKRFYNGRGGELRKVAYDNPADNVYVYQEFDDAGDLKGQPVTYLSSSMEYEFCEFLRSFKLV